MKSEMKMPWYRDREWNENVSKSRSRVKSKLKMPRDRDREVKFLENFREILRYSWESGNQQSTKFSNFVTNAFHFANFYSGIQQNAISESICHRGFGDGPWLRHVWLCGWQVFIGTAEQR